MLLIVNPSFCFNSLRDDNERARCEEGGRSQMGGGGAKGGEGGNWGKRESEALSGRDKDLGGTLGARIAIHVLPTRTPIFFSTVPNNSSLFFYLLFIFPSKCITSYNFIESGLAV